MYNVHTSDYYYSKLAYIYRLRFNLWFISIFWSLYQEILYVVHNFHRELTGLDVSLWPEHYTILCGRYHIEVVDVKNNNIRSSCTFSGRQDWFVQNYFDSLVVGDKLWWRFIFIIQPFWCLRKIVFHNLNVINMPNPIKLHRVLFWNLKRRRRELQ